jgi:ABC-type Fe3+/spermidine/putrescine transport system ATPase subunit
MLRIEGVTKRIGAGAEAFELRASFGVAAGDRAVLSGPSGSGKTTLLRMIAGLERPDGGRITLQDGDRTHELNELPAHLRRLGVVFQEQALFPSMTVLENVAFGLRMRKIARAERESESREWLARVGLAGREGSGIAGLSGGERQRVALARALITRPRALLLDEPFSALDPEARSVLRGVVLELHAAWPVPLLVVTHDQADAEALATRRWVLRPSSDGKLRCVQPG